MGVFPLNLLFIRTLILSLYFCGDETCYWSKQEALGFILMGISITLIESLEHVSSFLDGAKK